jgi:hypothetical protein
MVKIKKVIDPYPGFFLIVLAERVSYELFDEKSRTILALDFIQSVTT